MQGDERLYQAYQQLMKLLLVEAHSTPCWPAQEQGPQPRRFAIRIQYPVQCCCALGTDAGGSAALPAPLGPLHLSSAFPKNNPRPAQTQLHQFGGPSGRRAQESPLANASLTLGRAMIKLCRTTVLQPFQRFNYSTKITVCSVCVSVCAGRPLIVPIGPAWFEGAPGDPAFTRPIYPCPPPLSSARVESPGTLHVSTTRSGYVYFVLPIVACPSLTKPLFLGSTFHSSTVFPTFLFIPTQPSFLVRAGLVLFR